MVDEHRRRIDELLRTLCGDEEAFNRIAEEERLGVHLRHGRLYPAAVGQTHTGRLACKLLYSQRDLPAGSMRLADDVLRLTAYSRAG
jgi:hypothetical protein